MNTAKNLKITYYHEDYYLFLFNFYDGITRGYIKGGAFRVDNVFLQQYSQLKELTLQHYANDKQMMQLLEQFPRFGNASRLMSYFFIALCSVALVVFLVYFQTTLSVGIRMAVAFLAGGALYYVGFALPNRITQKQVAQFYDAVSKMLFLLRYRYLKQSKEKILSENPALKPHYETMLKNNFFI